jgi:osmoprotectant transport system substrate-binding protein
VLLLAHNVHSLADVAHDVKAIEDDRGVIPPYDAVVLTSRALGERAPDVIAALGRLAATIDADAMQKMNLAVDRDGRTPRDVAREFLAARPR